MNALVEDPVSGLVLPRQFIDQKQSLKKVIDDLVDSAVNSNQHIRETYFLTIHAKFDKFDPSQFTISQPVITYKLPPFVSNQFVFWVSNTKGICELLWMTSKKGKKITVDFNTQGVAYLKAKGAMPS
jgi:hypothetical protein